MHSLNTEQSQLFDKLQGKLWELYVGCRLYHSGNDLSIMNILETFTQSPMIWNCRFQILLMLRTSHVPHHHGWTRSQVSDRKPVNHTTEMILWSIILQSKGHERWHYSELEEQPLDSDFGTPNERFVMDANCLWSFGFEKHILGSKWGQSRP